MADFITWLWLRIIWPENPNAMPKR